METRDYYYYAYKKYKAKLKKLQRSQYRGGANPFASLSQDDDDDDDDEPEVEETIEFQEEEPLEGKGNRRFEEGDEVTVVTTEGNDITSQRGKCIRDSDDKYYIDTITGPKKKVTEDTETTSFTLIPSYYQY